jgi:hypothetical protein
MLTFDSKPAKPEAEVEAVSNWVFATMMMGDDINGRTYLSTDTFDVQETKEKPTSTGTVPKPPKPTKSGCPKPVSELCAVLDRSRLLITPT